MRAPLFALLLLAACAQPSREAVELAGALRAAPPGEAADRLAAKLAEAPPDCVLRDRACTTLWLHRGAACARIAAAGGPDAAARRDCAVAAFARALELTPADAPVAERAEAALRLADALERRRDRATGAARRADDVAILQAAATLRALPGGAGPAAHHEAGVALVRLLAGEVPAEARCAALDAAARLAAEARDAPGLSALGPRIAARRAAIAALRQDCPA